MKRTHDEFYLKDNNLFVKDSFVEIANRIVPGFEGSIIDVGCATGAFPRFLKIRFPKAQIYGAEYLQSLREKATQSFPDIEFIYGNVLDRHSIEKQFDIVTLAGVLCIFDDYHSVLANTLSWVKPGGKLILHNMVSEYDYDIFIKYSPSQLYFDESSLENGWNIISQKSLRLVVEKNDAVISSLDVFNIRSEISKDPADAMRSWTEKNQLNGLDIYNALHIRQPQMIAIIDRLK